MTNDNESEERERVPKTNEVPRAKRRGVVKLLAATAGAAAVGTFAVPAVSSLGTSSETSGSGLNYKNMFKSKEVEKNKKIKGVKLVDNDGNPIKEGSLKKGSGKEKTVFPQKKGGGALKMGKKTNILLARFKEEDFKKHTQVKFQKHAQKLNTNPGYRKKFTSKGYCAYSKWCTHEGCLVSARAGPKISSDGVQKYFHCPCHQSTYDPLKGCKVVGGPSPRALPQLPIEITSGKELIVATGPFIGPLGPHH